MRRALFFAFLLIARNATAAEPPPLGRLFLTPHQREQIDIERNAPSHLANSVVIDGEIRHNRKRPLHWSRQNNEWQPANLPRHVPIGDAYQPSSSRIRSLLGDGRIDIHPAETKP